MADSVDAMISHRSYKKPKPINDVITELIMQRGKQFDPEISKIMVKLLTRKQEYQYEILSKPITIGTIELLSDEKSCQLHGTLIKTNIGYRFKIDYNECTCAKCKCLLPSIVNSTFHVEYSGKIHEYSPSIKYKGKNEIYISKLIPKVSHDYFSLHWVLDGRLTLNNNESLAVTINKIGGDSLNFYSNKEQLNKDILKRISTVTINCEDGSEITISGKITKSIKVVPKIYYEFKYLNILESTRDKIFRQIFLKQTGVSRDMVRAMAGSQRWG